MPNFTVVAFKMWPYDHQNRQNGNFWLKKFAPREKLWLSIGTNEHRCTTTNLPLCNDTIIVLKLVLLHSVSVITNFVIPNFVIPKRDEKKQTKIPTILGMVIEEVSPILHPLTFFDPISSFAARSY